MRTAGIPMPSALVIACSLFCEYTQCLIKVYVGKDARVFALQYCIGSRRIEEIDYLLKRNISIWSFALIVCSLIQMTIAAFANSSAPSPLIRLSPDVVPKHYSIDLTINPGAIDFSGVVKIELTLAREKKSIVLHAADFSYDRIELHSGSVSQTATVQKRDSDGTIELNFINAVGPGDVTLEFIYHAPFSTGLEGLYKVVDNGSAAVFTQFEAIGARRAFPCFDEPSFKAPFDISLKVPQKLVAISNTRETNKTDNVDGFVTHRFATTKPLPTYLIAIAAGDFDVVEAQSIPPSDWRKEAVPLRGIAMRGKGEDLRIALNYTAKLVLAEEKYFGIAYPFDKLDIIAVPDFGAGGMENAGAITYDESIVFLDDDSTLQRRRDFQIGRASCRERVCYPV